jgi:hypothetical protein
MKRAALVLAILLSVVVAIHHSVTAFASTPNDQVAINVTEGTLATSNGVTASPLSLSPAFDPATNDYVLWCQSGVNSEQLTLNAASGSLTVTVPGPGGITETQSGSSVNVQVALGENQAVEVVTSQSTAGSYWVRCLPHDFPRMTITKGSATASMPGWYLTSNFTGSSSGPATSSYAMVLDQNGTPVWYQRTNSGINLTLLNDQTLAWAPSTYPVGGPYITYNLSNQTSSQVSPPQGPPDVHELQQLTSGPYNGDYVMISDPLVTGLDLSAVPDPDLQGLNAIVGCVVEIFTASGAPVWSWNAYPTIGLAESEHAALANYNGTDAADVYHCNSVDVSPNGTNLLVSMRQVSAVFDVTIDPGQPDNGTVQWKLGGNGVVPQGAKQLTLSGDPEGVFSGQHDARIEGVDTSTDQPTQISLYDDHTFSTNGGGSRGVVYNVNPTAGTATFVTQYPATDSQVAALATGSFRMYNGGTDNLVGWGYRSGGSGFTEFDQNGNVVMSQTFPNGEMNYRAIKVPLADLSLSELRATAGLPRAPYPSSPVWTPLPSGQFTSGPALTSWSSTRYDLFGRGPDGQLWHAYWTPAGWSGWEALGGQIAPGTGPAAVAWAPNRIDIFAEGVDGQLWHLAWTGSGWYGWEPLGGVLTSSPAVSSWGANRLDVVARGADDAIWHLAWTGSAWTGWESLGGLSLSSPGAASWAPNRVDVITEGLDGQAWHQWWDGTAWSGWAESVGGNLAGGPAMASVGANELDVMAAGQNYIPERLPYQTGWQLWQPLGQSPTLFPPIDPQTGYTPALVALGSNLEESCITNGVGGIECVQLPAGTPPSQQVPPPEAVSPNVPPQI